LESGGASGAPTDAQYVTLATNATLSDERVLTAGTGITLTDGGAGSTATIAISSAVATLTGSQTLTNKTLTSPVISTISNTGTITVPTATTTLVGRDTTDTLTNKTVTAPLLDSYYDIAEIADPANPAANRLRLYMDDTDEHLKAIDSVGNVTDLFTAGSGAPANSQYVTLSTDGTLSNERVLTAGTGISLTDAGAGSTVTAAIDSTVATLTGSQTLTNKAVNITDNTFTATSRATGDLIKDNGTKYARFGIGSANQFLKVNSGGTDIAYAALDVTLDSAALTTTNTKTVTNKTIDALLNTVENTGAFKYTIYRDGSTYYCRNNLSGAVEVSNSDPLTVLQFPLTNGGSCWVQEGDYELTGSPSVYLDFPVEPLYCEFYMDVNAWLVVPNGYAGTVIRIKNSATQHSTRHKLGVNITEAGGSATAVSDWTGILIEASGNTIKGVYDTRIVYGYLEFPGIGIKYNNDATCTSGFLTANFASNVLIWGPKTAGIDFGMDVTYTLTPDVNGIHRHRFRDITIQAISGRSDSCVGVRNVRHRDMTFDGVYCADFTTGSTATIHADADSIIIDGGSMTVTGKYTDNSTAQTVKIRDQYRHTQVSRITPGQSGASIDIVPTATTNTMSWYNSATTERFWIRKDGGTNEVYLDSIKQSAAGALRPIVVRMNDVDGATVTESFRVLTDARLQVFTNKFALLDSGGDHEYNFLTGNLAADRNITYPVLTGNDVPVFEAHSQTLTNKTIAAGSNTISGIVDANISAHTSTKITITSKSLLNSAILYNDVDNNLGAHYVNITEMAEPAAPSANNLRLYMDSADEHLKHINSVGRIIDITSLVGPIRSGGKKYGQFVGTSTAAGFGIFTTFTTTGTLAVGFDSTNGTYNGLTTSTVNGNGANMRFANPYTQRSFNPYLGVRFLVGTATNNRIHIGFKTTPFTAVTDDTDDPLATISGIMLVQRAADTNFFICTNDGDANSTFTDTGVAVNTSIHTIEFRAVGDTKFQWALDGGTWTDITSNIPGSTTAIGFLAGVQNDDGTAHTLRIYNIETSSDK
jgi:hypothetical protein